MLPILFQESFSHWKRVEVSCNAAQFLMLYDTHSPAYEDVDFRKEYQEDNLMLALLLGASINKALVAPMSQGLLSALETTSVLGALFKGLCSNPILQARQALNSVLEAVKISPHTAQSSAGLISTLNSALTNSPQLVFFYLDHFIEDYLKLTNQQPTLMLFDLYSYSAASLKALVTLISSTLKLLNSLAPIAWQGFIGEFDQVISKLFALDIESKSLDVNMRLFESAEDRRTFMEQTLIDSSISSTIKSLDKPKTNQATKATQVEASFFPGAHDQASDAARPYEEQVIKRPRAMSI